VNIFEAESNEAIARVSAQFGSRGTLEITTIAAITMQDMSENWKWQRLLTREFSPRLYENIQPIRTDLAFQWVDKYFKLVELIFEISDDEEK